jgi:hypothetical protein
MIYYVVVVVVDRWRSERARWMEMEAEVELGGMPTCSVPDTGYGQT